MSRRKERLKRRIIRMFQKRWRENDTRQKRYRDKGPARMYLDKCPSHMKHKLDNQIREYEKRGLVVNVKPWMKEVLVTVTPTREITYRLGETQ